MLPLAMAAPPATAADITTSPPATFKKVGSLVKLPDFVPGLGTLYVDPATLPVGPFLGYSHKGKLVNITYMVPLKSIEAHKNFETLGGVAAGVKLEPYRDSVQPGASRRGRAALSRRAMGNQPCRGKGADEVDAPIVTMRLAWGRCE
jgi:hypothetical protein